MRLKLTLRGSEARDLVVTCESSASVGDVAARLAGWGARRRGRASLTLKARLPGEHVDRLLNPLLPLHDSGLRSGAEVELAEFEPREVPIPTRRAVVEVLSGPNAGMRVALGAGVSFIGRDSAAHVSVSDHLVSRRHASVHVGAQTVVSDLNSVNGVEVDGALVDRVIVTARSVIRVGDTTLRIEPVGGEAAAPDAAASFTRSPRVAPQWVGEELPAPALPHAGERPRLPWIALVAPVVAGIALFALTRNPLMLLFIALSPVMMLGSFIDQRARHRRQRREEAERFSAGLDSLRSDLMTRSTSELAGRLVEAPGTSEVVSAARSRTPLLWTRLPEHASFLALRLGTGTLESRTSVQLPGRQLDGGDEWDRLSALVEEFRTIGEVPVVERLADAGAIGIAGRDMFAADLARALMLQVATLHSPAQVAIAAFAAADAAEEWEWLKWLPHVDSPHNPLSNSLADDLRSSARLLAELEELIATRRAASGASITVRSHLETDAPAAVGLWQPVQRAAAMPAIVVFIAGEPVADRGRLVQVAQDGPDVGVYTVWLADDTSRLPVVCRTFVAAEAASGVASFVRHGTVVPLTTLELASSVMVAECARLLAPLEDDGAPVLDESDLPRSVAFVELYDDDIAAEPDAVAARWARSDSLMGAWTAGQRREPGGLGGFLGLSADGPLRIDLRRDGPHALVGGTTGAGKSEFLQTWILGMAVENAPDRLTFLLVDYKGGSAFGDAVKLPHTVGLVTDLTPPLVKRALVSLRAELKRREELLAAKGAKDLLALEEQGDLDAPPALVIVIDEFAALVGEVPEFVDSVVDIAQRGRSLGIHLVMATQRPAGVIKDNLRANTNLRIGLRMADEADSQDVLGIDRAVRFDPDTPGRAAAKLGAGRVSDFQTAYVGGRSTRGRSIEIDVREFPFATGASWSTLTPSTGGNEDRDIDRLVDTIRRAADALQLRAPRRPWLDPLSPVVDLSALPATDGIALGIADIPARQHQSPFVLDLDAVGSVAVFGTGGTGKSTLLRTIAVAASKAENPAWLYAIDSTEALGALAALPNCGAVISLTDRERVARLFARLEEHVSVRGKLLAAANAGTVAEYNRRQPQGLPRVLVMIDSMAAFRAEYEFDAAGRLFDGFTQLVAAGRQVGIHFVLTADRQAAIPQALLASIQERIVLRMASPAEFEMLGVPRGMLDDVAPGRGYAHGQEVQFALPGGTAELSGQVSYIDEVAAGIVVVADPVERLLTMAQQSGQVWSGNNPGTSSAYEQHHYATPEDVNVVIPPILNPFAGEGAKVVVPLTVVQATTDPLGNHELIASNDVRNWSALGDVLKGLRQ